MEMRHGIIRLQFLGGLERRNGFGGAAAGDQRTPQADERVGEPGVELGGAPEVVDGGRPLLVLTRQLAQHVFGAGVGWIDFELFFEFAPRFIAAGGRLRRGEQQAPEAVVDAGAGSDSSSAPRDTPPPRPSSCPAFREPRHSVRAPDKNRERCNSNA